MSTRQGPQEGPTTCSVLNLARSVEGGDVPATAQALDDGQEHITEQQLRVATRQASARDCEERERQAEQETWLRDRKERFVQQAAQAATEAQMQAMADRGQRDLLCARLPVSAMLMLT